MMINQMWLLFMKRLRISGIGSINNSHSSEVCIFLICGHIVGKGQENYKGRELKWGEIRLRNISAIFENIQNVLRSRYRGKQSKISSLGVSLYSNLYP